MHTYVREKRILLNIIVSPTLRKQRNPTEKSIDFNDAHSVVSFWSLSSFHYDRLVLVVLVVSLVSFWWFRLFRFAVQVSVHAVIGHTCPMRSNRYNSVVDESTHC